MSSGDVTLKISAPIQKRIPMWYLIILSIICISSCIAALTVNIYFGIVAAIIMMLVVVFQVWSSIQYHKYLPRKDDIIRVGIDNTGKITKVVKDEKGNITVTVNKINN